MFSDLMENRSFWGSGRPRAAQKAFKKVEGKAPYLFKGFLGRPGPPRTPKRPILHQITKPPLQNPPGVLLKDPGVLLKDPGILLKDPGVLLKDPGVL